MTEEQQRLLIETLEFYAAPESYFAIVISGDSPCGEFAEDFEEIEEMGQKEPRPGARARAALRALQGGIEKMPEDYSIEKNAFDDAWTLYAGRNTDQHGYNLCQLSLFDVNGERTRADIVRALNWFSCKMNAQNKDAETTRSRVKEAEEILEEISLKTSFMDTDGRCCSFCFTRRTGDVQPHEKDCPFSKILEIVRDLSDKGAHDRPEESEER